MSKNHLLIIADKAITVPKVKNCDYHIDLLNLKHNSNLIKILNTQYKNKYDYLFFTKSCKYVNEFLYYLPVNYISNNNYQLYINELNVNTALINNISLVVKEKDVNDIAILIKYLLKNFCREKNFNFKDILQEIKRNNDLSDKDILFYKKRVLKIIQKHYSQNNILRAIRFKLHREKIIKDFAYRNLRNVLKDLKNEIKETEKVIELIKEEINFSKRLEYVTNEKK